MSIRQKNPNGAWKRRIPGPHQQKEDEDSVERPQQDEERIRQRQNIKPKRRIKASPIEAKLDLSGEYSFSNMMNSSLDDEIEVNQVLIDEFKVKEDVKMFSQLPDYDDFRWADLSNEGDLATAYKRSYGAFRKPSRRTLKHHLLNINRRRNYPGI